MSYALPLDMHADEFVVPSFCTFGNGDSSDTLFVHFDCK